MDAAWTTHAGHALNLPMMAAMDNMQGSFKILGAGLCSTANSTLAGEGAAVHQMPRPRRR